MERLLPPTEPQSLLSEDWPAVDTIRGRTAPEYYTEDGIFEGPEATYQGRQKIRDFYEWRVKRGKRLAVHAVNNFRVQFEDENRATCTWYMLLYAADGAPVLPTHPPIQIALVTDKCVRDASGRWLYAHRKFEALFQGGTPPTNPKL
jgi:hypothetical protein